MTDLQFLFQIKQRYALICRDGFIRVKLYFQNDGRAEIKAEYRGPLGFAIQITKEKPCKIKELLQTNDENLPFILQDIVIDALHSLVNLPSSKEFHKQIFSHIDDTNDAEESLRLSRLKAYISERLEKDKATLDMKVKTIVDDIIAKEQQERGV